MATTKATTLGHRTIPTSAVTSGTFADARIAASNVTQHEGSIDALASNPTITLGSNTTFPSKVTDYTHFYPAWKDATTMGAYDRWATSSDAQDGYVYLTGVAPTGFTTIVDMHYWFIAEQSGSNNYQAQLAWGISTTGETMNNHSLSNTTIFTGLSVAQYYMKRMDIMAVGSSGSRFEDLIANNDAFGMRINHNTAIAVRALGLSITWRF